MNCKCGNAARYINELGEFCCALCPIKEGLDSIRLSNVPALLSFVRHLLVGEFSPYVDGWQPNGPILQGAENRRSLRAIIGKDPRFGENSGDWSKL
jgi:hypothetical protein